MKKAILISVFATFALSATFTLSSCSKEEFSEEQTTVNSYNPIKGGNGTNITRGEEPQGTGVSFNDPCKGGNGTKK